MCSLSPNVCRRENWWSTRRHWSGAAEFDARQPFPVFRHPGQLMLPGRAGPPPRSGTDPRTPAVRAVWYGAAAPLSLLTPALRAAGVVRAVASTHGHEVGWSMVPGARRALRRIGQSNDVITFVSQFARRRISAALGPDAALEYLPPGVRVDTFRPDPAAGRMIRARYGVGRSAAAAVGVPTGHPQGAGQPDQSRAGHRGQGAQTAGADRRRRTGRPTAAGPGQLHWV